MRGDAAEPKREPKEEPEERQRASGHQCDASRLKWLEKKDKTSNDKTSNDININVLKLLAFMPSHIRTSNISRLSLA